MDTLKSKINGLKEELSAKDSIINNYKLTIHEYSSQKDHDASKHSNL